MKLNCGPTWEEKKAAREQWHRWFAWWPVRIASGDCRWLETVERKGKYCGTFSVDFWVWEYRPIRTQEAGDE